MNRQSAVRAGCLLLVWLLIGCSGSYVNLDLFESSLGGSGGATGTPASSECSATCASDTPFCNSTLGKCVACLKHADCTEDGLALCDTASGSCVACLSSLDCSSEEALTCNPLTRRCVECTSANDCTDGMGCDPATNECVEPCSSSSECGEDEGLTLCDPESLTCVQCLQDSDCPEDQRPCDLVRHRCAAD